MLHAALCLLLAAAPANGAVDTGLELYRHGDFKGAAIVLSRALEAGVDDAQQKVTAQEFLASAYDALGDGEHARATLAKLFEETPLATLDPAVFPPSFLSLAEEVRHDVLSKRAPPPERPPEPAKPAEVPKAEVPPAASLPLAPPPAVKRGVPTGAWILGGVGAASLATGATFALLSRSAASGDAPSQQAGFTVHTVTYQQASSANADARAALIATAAGVALVGAGVAWWLASR